MSIYDGKIEPLPTQKKTLTEKWRNGTLEQRYYYVKYFGNGQKPFVEIELKNFLLDLVNVKDRDNVEVLAAVPSYDEYKRLEERLEIATKALNDMKINKTGI